MLKLHERTKSRKKQRGSSKSEDDRIDQSSQHTKFQTREPLPT
jgi:hypothetical protein